MAIAGAPLPEGAFYEDLCFHAQQAAEKGIKAVYRAKNLRFPYTHDLSRLLVGPENSAINLPPEAKRAIELTEFALQSRYPGVGEPVTAQDHDPALQIETGVVRWAETVIGDAR